MICKSNVGTSTTPSQDSFELYFAQHMIAKMGFEDWEAYQIKQHQTMMEIFDDFTGQIEMNGGTAAELAARRLLTVELNIKHHDFITEVFRLHFANL